MKLLLAILLAAYPMFGQQTITLQPGQTIIITAAASGAGNAVPDYCTPAATGLPGLPAPLLPGLPVCMQPAYPFFASTSSQVATMAALQSAVNAAQCGQRIIVTAGVTYAGNLMIPATECTALPILLESSAIASLPAYSIPARALAGGSSFPVLATQNSTAALQIANGASGWYFAGLEFTLSPTAQNVYPIIAMGENAATSAQLPSFITFDRCLIHPSSASPNNFVARGIDLNGVYVSLISSAIWGIVATGQDTQAVNISNTTGPVLVAGNDLEATGENVMLNTTCPGNDGNGNQPGVGLYPACPPPSDITIRRNHLTKLASWRNAPPGCCNPGSCTTGQQQQCYDVKNVIECKDCQRVLVDSNVLDTTFSEAQAEFLIMNCLWTGPYVCSDLTVTNNLFEHGPEVGAFGGNGNSQTGQRILIRNNIAIDISGVAWGGTGVSFQIQNTNYFTADHNTIINQPPLYINGLNFSDAPPSSDINFRYSYNFQFASPFANGMSPGQAIAALPTPTLLATAFVGDWWPNNYPANGGTPASFGSPAYPLSIYTPRSMAVPVAGQHGCNYSNFPIAACWPLDWATVGFVDFNGGNAGTDLPGLALASGTPYKSVDGTFDMGANIPAVLAAIQGVQVQ